MKIINNSECLSGFGEFIKNGREAKCLRQSDVAELVDISQAYYSMIERGERQVDFVLALEITKALNIDINDFIRSYM
jgi:transcriptional regulator with XRE-family HTH domain